MKFQPWEKKMKKTDKDIIICGDQRPYVEMVRGYWQLKSIELVTLETYGRYQRTYQIYEDGTFVKMEYGDMPAIHIDTLKQKLEENGAIVWIDRSAYSTCERANIQEIAQSLTK